MTHIFVDTDIILDIITGRQPFSVEASRLFTLIEEEALASELPVMTPGTFIQLVCKTTSLKGVDIRTNLLISDILFDNIKRCTSAGSDKIAWRP